LINAFVFGSLRGESRRHAQIAASPRRHVVALDDLRQKLRRFRAAHAPDDIAPGKRIPFVANHCEPCVEADVLVADRADAERFKIPAVLAVVLRGERGPEFFDLVRAVK
jgi:hypothetical protein